MPSKTPSRAATSPSPSKSAETALERAIRAEVRAEYLERRVAELTAERDEWKAAFQKLTDEVIFQSGHRPVFDPAAVERQPVETQAQAETRHAPRTAKEWRSVTAPRLMRDMNLTMAQFQAGLQAARAKGGGEEAVEQLVTAGERVIEKGA